MRFLHINPSVRLLLQPAPVENFRGPIGRRPPDCHAILLTIVSLKRVLIHILILLILFSTFRFKNGCCSEIGNQILLGRLVVKHILRFDVPMDDVPDFHGMQTLNDLIENE